jgi:hypothetical protein
MYSIPKQDFNLYITQFQFRQLFNELGWDKDKTTQNIVVDKQTYLLQAVAEKRGFKILLCNPSSNGTIPDYATRKKIETNVTKLFQEHLIIFIDTLKTEQIWHIVHREIGKPNKTTETRWHSQQTQAELLYQRAAGIFFDLDEEENITIIDVTKRMSDNFHQNNEKVTKKFYTDFKKEHGAFIAFIKGIATKTDQEWYASLMLNRLMFCYFIQKKGFLNNNKNYLRDKLNACKTQKEKGNFYSFYRSFLLILFHQGLNGVLPHSQQTEQTLGKIPYLNGGLFDEHELEKNNANIDIDDKAFERLFNFFDQYEWHLDTRHTASGKDINPDVIGYIFEKYINDRANMGAYYTKEDITDYISKNCIIPFLLDETKRKYPKAFQETAEVWQSLQQSGKQYIYDSLQKGTELPLPDEIAKGIDTTQSQLIERRSEWNKPAPEQYALPTEIWREVVERRNRYHLIYNKIANGEIKQINDLITYNLNIRQFAQDLIENTNDPQFLKQCYETLNKITIIDPTCGSGAFLFAALNILEPLYEACILRMRGFVEDEDRQNANNKQHFNHQFKHFRQILQNIQSPQHPNLQYFIYKSIILQNLYGVDIMHEAVEIAKLRLFLKLVATVDADTNKHNCGLEPLPDIDFNIRAGNTLIGFATEKELEIGLTYTLDGISAKPTIEEKCNIVADTYKHYKKIQLSSHGNDMADFKIAKQNLNNRLYDLNHELNQLLHKQYAAIPYQQWLQTHQPFHWFAEFYEILKENNGFDVIIGNPPYVVYAASNFVYKLKDFNTLSCSNLYAYCIERSYSILNKIGRFGMIVPNSSISADKLNPLQKLITKGKISWISNYSWRPSKLFEGADMLLAIIITAPSAEKQIYSSKYHKWYSDYRPSLFTNIVFHQTTQISIEGSIPKLPLQIYFSIIKKLVNKSRKKILANSFQTSPTNHFFYYFRAVQYWVKTLDNPPIYLDNGIQTSTSEMIPIYAVDEDSKYVLISLLSSSLYFIHYITWASCQVINSRDFQFLFDIENLSPDLKIQLKNLGIKLQTDYQSNSKTIERSYSKKGRNFTMVKQHFYIKKSKFIIDEIDRVLSLHYGFTEEELDFLINYDIKYRMGKELDSGDEA